MLSQGGYSYIIGGSSDHYHYQNQHVPHQGRVPGGGGGDGEADPRDAAHHVPPHHSHEYHWFVSRFPSHGAIDYDVSGHATNYMKRFFFEAQVCIF